MSVTWTPPATLLRSAQYTYGSGGGGEEEEEEEEEGKELAHTSHSLAFRQNGAGS
jgi:hypothetical protein